MKLLRCILTLYFTLLVLISGSSFMIGLHLCGGQVQNFAFFSKADDCEKERQLSPCHRHEAPPCCEDETVIHEGLDFKHSFSEINFALDATPIANAAGLQIFNVLPGKIVPAVYTDYDPPFRSCDLTISLQVFLI